MNIKQQTNNVASQGRYGDTMLMHVNPAEVQGLASVMPLTRNPETGQPEAFLPFLLPLLGSALGTAGLTGAGAGALGGLIGATGLSSAAAGAIGSGLTTALIEGDLKKGIMSGITGFGMGKVMGAAGLGGTEAIADEASKAAITDAATSNAVTAATLGESAGQAVTDAATSNFSGDAIGSLVESSGLNATDLQEALGSGLTSQADLIAQASAANPNFIAPGMQGFGNRLGAIGKGAFSGDTMSALTSPTGYLPIALGEGQKGVMESQENFERQMAQMKLDREQAKKDMYANNPENIPSSSRYYGSGGGLMSLAEGGKTLPKAPKKKNPRDDELRFPPPERSKQQMPIADNSFEAAMSGSQDYRYMPKADTRPVTESYQKMQKSAVTGAEMPTGQYVPASNYKAGVDAEFNYFPDSNRPASYLGNYLGNVGLGGLAGLGGLGGGFDGLNDFDIRDYLGGEGENDYDLGNMDFSNLDFSNLGNQYPKPNMPTPYMPTVNPSINPQIPDFGGALGNLMGGGNQSTIPADFNPVAGISGSGVPPVQNLGDFRDGLPSVTDFDNNFSVSQLNDMRNKFGPSNEDMPIERPFIAELSPMEIKRNDLMSIAQEPIAPPPRDQDMMARLSPAQLASIGAPMSQSALDQQAPMAPVPGTNVIPRPPVMAPPAMQQPVAPLVPPMPLTLRNDLGLPMIRNPEEMSLEELNVSRRMPPMRMAEGKQLPNQGLEALNSVAPEVVSRMGYQEGGMTPSNQDVQQLAEAVMGQSPNADAVINMFIEKYGNELFMQVREMILNPQGQAQTQGMIKGQGGGMDDEVMGMIGNQRPVAVSPGEYIVPADVVSGLGDGASDAGAEELDGMLDRVRQERTGTTKQAPQLANAGGMLPR